VHVNERRDGRAEILSPVVAARSDVGCVRPNNEDCHGAFTGEWPSQGLLVIVADGMGGAAGGEVASRLAVETVRAAYFEATVDPDRRAILRRALLRANEAIYMRAAGDPDLTGMGTTCTAVVILGHAAIFGHVGDSRAYLARRDRITQLTRDHSLAAELERRCVPGQAVPQAGRHVLTRCLGVASQVEVDTNETPIELEPGDHLLLCSDGLSGPVTAAEMLRAVRELEPQAACDRLVTLARERGGPDNVTVQIVRLTLDGR
jgi:protein phosphatase